MFVLGPLTSGTLLPMTDPLGTYMCTFPAAVKCQCCEGNDLAELWLDVSRSYRYDRSHLQQCAL